MMAARARTLKTLGPTLLWIAGVAFLLRSYRAQQLRPAGGHFAADTLGTVALACVLMAVETAALYAIIRPWSYWRSVERTLLALGIFVPWTFLSLLGTMHAASAFLIHSMWLGLVDLVLFAGLIVSAVGRRAETTSQA